MPNTVIYTDASATATGSLLNSSDLNTAVPAAPYVVTGGVPSSVSGASLQISQPLTQAVVQSSATVVQYVQVAAQSLTVPSSPTGVWYVDLTPAGAYSVNQLSVPASTNLRLYQVTSSGTGLSLLVQLASGAPVVASQVQADSSEAQTNDTLTGSSTLVNNLNRIRYQLGQVMGGAWNAATAMIPLSQKGAASGVASLDANSHVLQRVVYDSTEASTLDTLGATSTLVNNLNRIRNQLGVVIGNAGTSWNAAVQMIPLSQKGAASGVAALSAQTALTGTTAVAVRCHDEPFGSPGNGISIPNATYTTLTYNVNEFDQGTPSPQHSTTTNPSRLTCQVAGVYLIHANVDFLPSTAGTRRVILQLNGTMWIAWQEVGANPSSYDVALSVSTTYALSIGDYVEVQVYQNTGAALTIAGWDTTQNSPAFGMARVA